MSNELTHRISSGAIQGTSGFSTPRSLQLFIQGLTGLQAYERTPNPKSLGDAVQALEQCVQSYPSDALPQFYLGLAKTLVGSAPALERAINLFSVLRDSGPEFLRLPAEYNLAAAHVEKYGPNDTEQAERLLRGLLNKVGTRAPQSPIRRFLARVGFSDSIARLRQVDALRAQALALLAFCLTRQRLWEHRRQRTPVDDQLRQHEPEIDGFLKEATGLVNPPLTESVRREVLADAANVRGLLAEYKAHGHDKRVDRKLAETAIAHFNEATRYRPKWIPALGNMARVHLELLSNWSETEALCTAVFAIRPDEEYAHYLMGQVRQQQGKAIEAVKHYMKAPNIPKAAERAKPLLDQLPWYERPEL